MSTCSEINSGQKFWLRVTSKFSATTSLTTDFGRLRKP